MTRRSIKVELFSLRSLRALAISLALVGALLASALVGSAGAALQAPTPAPGWEINQRVYPTHLKPGGSGTLVIQVFNIGAGSTNGPVTVTDKLPGGLEAVDGESGALAPLGYVSNEEVEGYEMSDEQEEEREAKGELTSTPEQLRQWHCTGTTEVTCTTGPNKEGKEPPIKAGFAGRIGIKVNVTGSAGTYENEVEVSGGGAATTAESSVPLTVSSEPAGFGIAGFNGWFSNANGTIDNQAGSHPYEMTLNFDLNAGDLGPAGGKAREVAIALPPGVIGNPHAVPQCARQAFMQSLEGGCPPDTQVGVDRPGLESEGEFDSGDFEARLPVYNLKPREGSPAAFGFTAFGSNIIIEAGVRSGSDYGITGTVRDLALEPVYNSITFWGVPLEKSHQYERCGVPNLGSEATHCSWAAGGVPSKPLLTVPTSCEGPSTFGLDVSSWNSALAPANDSFTTKDASEVPVGFTGCERLIFPPSISVAPDTSYTDSPAGLTVDLKVPQEGLEEPYGYVTSNIKDTTVTLPEGVAINPGQAAGLAACGPAEDGLTTEAEKAEGKEDNGPAKCPNASRVGTDEIETPLLSKPLKGSVYILPSNPPHLQLLVTAEGEGVFLKLVGEVNLNEGNGRLVTTFASTPELPFTDFKLSFNGGAQAALTTPTHCGTYATSSDFTPWSTPFVADAFPKSLFTIDAGLAGAACPSTPLPFTPTLIAGSTTDQAGGYTDFSMLLTRPDDQQRIGSLKFDVPEGLIGMISKVPLCTNAQAETNTCPEASKIGHTTVEAGPGPYPLVVPEPGQPAAPIYLTEGYEGAPYGLSIVVPLHVGPFTLPTQRVRAKIEVNPITAALTVTTNELPQEVAGVPTDLREVDAIIERPEFMFNPTNCEATSFSGTATGAAPPGTSEAPETAAISTRFQVGSCRSLAFKPDLTASTSAKSSRREGASLKVKIAFPSEAQGSHQATSQANIHFVKVELPKQLPSELKTLQQACLAQVFDEDPAKCPAHSMVGSAVVHTPVLSDQLEGPAYFVSYGGAKFPELVVVLKGDGVTVDVHGETFISEKGVTSSTFKTVPDVPFSSFELTLPEGEYSALGAPGGKLCAKKLEMPTTLIGQNGAKLTQTTNIAVTGCSDTLSVESHKVSKGQLTLKVSVPSAGKLTVTGKGVTQKSKKASSRETLKLKLKLSKASKGARKLKLKLAFKPKAGKAKRLHKSLSVRLPR
jgi:hypothetical protein